MESAATTLLVTIQELSLVRDLTTLTYVIRKAARKISKADGIAFVLKDQDHCYYADEDAIGPLWKGHRFPMTECISGWVMITKAPAVIRDIYSDSRIPHHAYEPAFVKSLAMLPIRTVEPIGALGFYWKDFYTPEIHELELMQALADITAVSIENLQGYSYLKDAGISTENSQKIDTLFAPQKLVDSIKTISR